MAGNQYWKSCVLAMYMRGSENGTSFPDEKGHTPTVNSAVTKTSIADPFGASTGVGDFNGSRYVTFPDSADFEFGSGDVTMRAWVRLTSLPSAGNSMMILAKYKTDTNDRSFFWAVFNNSGSYSLRCVIYSSGASSPFTSYEGSFTPVLNTWFHAELTINSGSLRQFVNGTQVGSTGTAIAMYNGVGLLSVGATQTATSGIVGQLSNVEIYKGVAIHTSSFSAPTTPFINHYLQAEGIVLDVNGAPVAKPVHVHRQSDGALAGIATSNGTTGAFSIETLDATEHYATCIYSNDEPAITIHNITPV